MPSGRLDGAQDPVCSRILRLPRVQSTLRFSLNELGELQALLAAENSRSRDSTTPEAPIAQPQTPLHPMRQERAQCEAQPAATGLAARHRSASWGTLASPAPLPVAPRFKPSGGSSTPALDSGAGGPWPTAGSSSHAGATARPGGAWAAGRRSHPGSPAQTAGRQQQQGGQHKQSASQVQMLLDVYPWAGADLAAAVLAALGGSAEAAAAALADMVAGPEQPQRAFPAHQQSGEQQQPAPSSSSGGSAGEEEAKEEDAGSEGEEEQAADPYHRHRRHALRLSRRWQRAARGAAAAYAAGRHGEARQLAGEAQRAQREALAAHAEAAERIETENNRHKSPFELDLHGLHSQEALAALDRRLALLHSLLADPATAAALPGSGQPWLRVIVGRGAHSSGGEASLPRVVASHLQAAGLRYQPRGAGALDVALRAAFGLGAAPAGAGAAGRQAAARGR